MFITINVVSKSDDHSAFTLTYFPHWLEWGEEDEDTCVFGYWVPFTPGDDTDVDDVDNRNNDSFANKCFPTTTFGYIRSHRGRVFQWSLNETFKCSFVPFEDDFTWDTHKGETQSSLPKSGIFRTHIKEIV